VAKKKAVKKKVVKKAVSAVKKAVKKVTAKKADKVLPECVCYKALPKKYAANERFKFERKVSKGVVSYTILTKGGKGETISENAYKSHFRKVTS
jgi:hypothetical protein